MAAPASPTYEPKITPEFVTRALGLTIPQAILAHLPESFSSVTTDSRKIEPGCLFVCLKGDRFDAHDFIPQAIEKGAQGIVCLRGTSIADPRSAQIFAVEDTVEAFRSLAYHWRREFSCPVIAVAGSVGKTTTKEILTSVLGGKYSSILKTQGSQNGFLGIPMTLMELRAHHQIAVIEVGIDEIGAMKQHMDLVGANASLLTTIGPEHLEKLRDVATVAQEEGIALTSVAQAGGLIAISLDDPWIKPHAKSIHQGTHVTYSLSQKDATVYGAYSDSDNSLTVTRSGEPSATRYPLPIQGKHNALNTLAAIALASGLGLTASEIERGLKTFRPVGGRSELKSIGPIQFVCDYYNANPTSTEAGLELLCQIAARSGAKNRFACLGDMLELGADEERFHRDLAGSLIRLRIEHVYLFGPRMKWLADELSQRSFMGEYRHFEQHAPLSSLVAQTIRAGDVVLIKGSHGMKMEEVYKSLEQCLPKS
jgi:UDP-N-acetylmuramoyl-tripeptide--D-alanyl-D-alanine ligase